MDNNNGNLMYSLAEELFPINRSITGPGTQKTLEIIQREIPDLNIFKIPSGEKVFDWTVPEEWSVNDAFIIDPLGNKILKFKENNLHLVGYSTPFKGELSLEELQSHLHSLPDQPDAIPYVTSYYEKNWGFCLSHKERESLKDGTYEVNVNTELKKGSLNYGEIILKGNSQKEIFFSTYVCHPSMANNELSGPVVLTHIIKFIQEIKNRNFSYRIVFIPETIGSIAYLSKNLEILKQNVIAGYNITCVGDNKEYSYIASRDGNTLSDRLLKHVLKHEIKKFKAYSFLERGSDERQYCSPGVDLPLSVFCRSKFGEYSEYHTSLDNLDFISPEGLQGSYNVLKKVIEAHEMNKNYHSNTICEPQLGKRGLYPNVSKKEIYNNVKMQNDLIAYCDGRSLFEISEILDCSISKLLPIVNNLLKHQLIRLDE